MKKKIMALILGMALAMTACGGSADQAGSASAASEPAASGSSAAAEAAEEAVEETAEEASSEGEEEQEPVQETEAEGSSQFVLPTEDFEVENGILSFRLFDGGKVDGFYWTVWEGDKGDASFAELLTQSDMEEGLDYSASFRAIPDAGDGEDYIRIVYTNGIYVMAYYDIYITVENGAILDDVVLESTEIFPDEEYLALIGGAWTEEDGGGSHMNISLSEAGGFDVVIYDDTAEDPASVYTMHAYNDAISGQLLYVDGAPQTAPAEGSESSISIGGGSGTGVLDIEDSDDLESVVSITWYDKTDGHEAIRFVK